jgi:osmotically-inducible protein OsmY
MTLTRQPRVFASLITLCLAIAACGPSDADIKAEADKAIAVVPGATVDVVSGVATISGQVANDAARTTAETAVKGVKGVKSVIDNATLVPPPVVISADDSLKTNVAAALKGVPTLNADVKDGVVTLTGQVKKTALPKVMRALSALHPKKIDNKATVKK